MVGITEQLLHATVRIEAVDANGIQSCGTGFFFSFDLGEGKVYPTLISNKHVVQNKASAFFYLTLATPDGEPDYGKHQRIDVTEFSKAWIDHPDPDVDLAIFPLGLILKFWPLEQPPFYKAIDKRLIPDASALDKLNAIEDVMMIGYPNGLWDAVSNLPIVRRGITGTPAFIDYNGKPEFLIDAACFPGSSGSPVFVVNQGMVQERSGTISIGDSRILFLGILYAGPQVSVTGEIVVQAAPTNVKSLPVMNLMMNLGICVNASKVLDFEKILRSKCGIAAPDKRLAVNDTAA